MEKQVKHLDVKWTPEIVAAVSLTIATGSGTEQNIPAADKMVAALNTDAPVRRIVIFQGADLRTDVLVTR